MSISDMELSPTGHKQTFRQELDHLLDDMQASYDEGYISGRLDEFQGKLDSLAEKYQNDESLGKLRYKLYEAQAYLHFFSGDYDKATNFINEAVNVRGEDFEGAQSLRQVIGEHSAVNDKPQPITGWLALFVFGLLVGVLYNLYEFFTGFSSLKLITPDVSAAYPNLRSLITVEQIVQVGLAIFGIYLLYLVYKRRHSFKPLGIIFLASSLLWFAVDMTIAQNMFANNSAALQQVNNISPTEGRSIFFSFVWLLYLIFSKDVKRVFTR